MRVCACRIVCQGFFGRIYDIISVRADHALETRREDRIMDHDKTTRNLARLRQSLARHLPDTLRIIEAEWSNPAVPPNRLQAPYRASIDGEAARNEYAPTCRCPEFDVLLSEQDIAFMLFNRLR
jgi:hypothetical protein